MTYRELWPEVKRRAAEIANDAELMDKLMADEKNTRETELILFGLFAQDCVLVADRARKMLAVAVEEVHGNAEREEE